MKKTLDEIKTEFTELNHQTQAATKGGASVYFTPIGNNQYSVTNIKGQTAIVSGGWTSGWSSSSYGDYTNGYSGGGGSYNNPGDPNLFNMSGPLLNDAAGYNFLGYDDNGYGNDGYNLFTGYDHFGYDRAGHHNLAYDVWHGYDPYDWTSVVDSNGTPLNPDGNGGVGGGGNGGGYSSGNSNQGTYGSDPYSMMPTPPGVVDFGQSSTYVVVSTETLHQTTTEGGAITAIITYYTYFNGTDYVSEKVEWQEYIGLSNGSTAYWDFGSHNESFIWSNYNRPENQIAAQNDPPPDIYGYFDDLNIVNDPNAFGEDGYNAFGVNADGFDRYGINASTNTPYNNSGFDQFGLSADGYNQQQYTDAGGFINGFNANGYSANGMSEGDYLAHGGYINGYNQFGMSASGHSYVEYGLAGGYIDGYDASGRSAAGYTAQDYANYEGYINGYNQFGISPAGYTAADYAANGGFIEGWDAEGRSATGFYQWQYEANGGYVNGFDEFGMSAAGHTASEYANNGGYINGYNQFGISAAGYTAADYAANGGFIDGLDPEGRDADGFYLWQYNENGGSSTEGEGPGNIRYLVQPQADEYGNVYDMWGNIITNIYASGNQNGPDDDSQVRWNKETNALEYSNDGGSTWFAYNINLEGVNISSVSAIPPSWVRRDLFGIENPIEALAIGINQTGGTNISSDAVRFSTRGTSPDSDSILQENTTPGEENTGSEVNAFRHTIWQATISNMFGFDIAAQVGYAHEDVPGAIDGLSNEELSSKSFPTALKVDESIDLANNIIGRQIGTSNPTMGMRDLALQALDRFASTGLWTSVRNSDGTYGMRLTTITADKYNQMRNVIMTLDDDGFTPAEAAKRMQDAIEWMKTHD